MESRAGASAAEHAQQRRGARTDGECLRGRDEPEAAGVGLRGGLGAERSEGRERGAGGVGRDEDCLRSP
jgi:hypothetical protein